MAMVIETEAVTRTSHSSGWRSPASDDQPVSPEVPDASRHMHHSRAAPEELEAACEKHVLEHLLSLDLPPSCPRQVSSFAPIPGWAAPGQLLLSRQVPQGMQEQG